MIMSILTGAPGPVEFHILKKIKTTHHNLYKQIIISELHKYTHHNKQYKHLF